MNKMIGTLYTKGKKKYAVCSDCQKRFGKEEIKTKLEI